MHMIMPLKKACYRNEDIHCIRAVWQVFHHMHSNRKNEQDQVKVSSMSDRRVVTVRDQEIRKKRSAKTRSAIEVTERREAMLNKEIP